MASVRWRRRYIERLNGIYRHELLDANRFDTLDDVQELTRKRTIVYDYQRIHSAIGDLPPKVFKQRWQQRNESLRLAGAG